METTQRFHLPWAFLPVSAGYPDSSAGWWVVLFLHSPPSFSPPPPLLNRANSWVALSWQNNQMVLIPFPLILLLLMEIYLGWWSPLWYLVATDLCKVSSPWLATAWKKCMFWTSWCVGGPWLRRTGSFLHVCWVFHQIGWNHKAVGKGSREKSCGVFYPDHMKQPNCQMCFIRKFKRMRGI